MQWFEQARAAEQICDWETAIALVSVHAGCHSADPSAHDNHLWHLETAGLTGRGVVEASR
ncbi:hypothetical protein [Streptomyces sp. NPDC004270]